MELAENICCTHISIFKTLRLKDNKIVRTAGPAMVVQAAFKMTFRKEKQRQKEVKEHWM